MAIRAILFDLDGTLVDTEREYAEAMARALREGQGVEIGRAEREFIVGRSWVAIYAHLRARHPEIEWSRDELIAATAAAHQALCEELGISVLPGAVAAVRRFSHLGRAIVTGSSRVEATHVLTSVGLDAEFDVVIASEDVSQSKPSPDGYRAAAATLGVEPASCVVVEDAESGIVAGLAAGALVVAVRAGNFLGQDQSRANRIIDTLEELTPELVDGLVR